MAHLFLFLILAIIPTDTLSNQNEARFQPAIEIFNDTDQPIESDAGILPPQAAYITQEHFNFVYNDKKIMVQWIPANLPPAGSQFCACSLEVSTLAWLAQAGHWRQGLDEVCFKNAGYCPVELKASPASSNVIFIAPGETIAKNAAIYAKKALRIFINKLIVTDRETSVEVFYPCRVYNENAMHTTDFRSQTIDVATLLACKKYNITVTAQQSA